MTLKGVKSEMEIEQLTVSKKKAQDEFQALKQAFKTNRKLKSQQLYLDFQKVYGHLQHGGKVIELSESFKKAGLNKDGDPKLAIVRADSKIVVCGEHSDGSATYYHDRQTFDIIQKWWKLQGDKHDIDLPQDTFQFPNPRRKTTPVPIIPPKILIKEVKLLLRNYHIIWEVEAWKPIPPRDPILVRRLTGNLFGVLATWNLTKLERAIIRGRL